MACRSERSYQPINRSLVVAASDLGDFVQNVSFQNTTTDMSAWVRRMKLKRASVPGFGLLSNWWRNLGLRNYESISKPKASSCLGLGLPSRLTGENAVRTWVLPRQNALSACRASRVRMRENCHNRMLSGHRDDELRTLCCAADSNQTSVGFDNALHNR